MAETGLRAFDATLQKTHSWLNELKEELGFQEDQKVYFLLRSVMHALRDRLTPEEAVQLGAQLPMLIRGMYYDGFTLKVPADLPRTKAEFITAVRERFHQDPQMDVEKGVLAVFGLLTRHISEGEMEDIRRILPEDMKPLIPAA